jgi:hypothetical protein
VSRNRKPAAVVPTTIGRERVKMAKYIKQHNNDPDNEPLYDDLDYWADECDVHTVCTEKLDPHVVVMKPSKDWA